MTVLRRGSCFDRHPKLEPTGSRSRVKFLVIAFEVGGVDELVPRFRQPFVPDRDPATPNRGDVLAVGKHGVLLGWDSDVCELRGEQRKMGHLDSGQVPE